MEIEALIIHQECLALSHLININRHDHHVPHTSVLGVVNYVSGISWKKVDWTCGGYSCKKCYSYVVYSKWATRPDVCKRKEVEGLLEESEDTKPYMDDNKIQHFSHTKTLPKTQLYSYFV